MINMDPIIILQLIKVLIHVILAVLILILSYLGFKKRHDNRLLYIGFAFFLILVMPTILAYLSDHPEISWYVPYLGYFLIAYALFRFWRD